MSNAYWQSQYGHQLLLDGDAHARRWLDVRGPDSFGVSLDFTDEPVASGLYTPRWTITTVGSSTFGPTDGQGGLGRITTGNVDNDGINAQFIGESFRLTSAARVYFGLRKRISEATQSDWYAGLALTDTDILGACTDHLGFDKVDATTNIEAFVNKNSTRTEVASAIATQDSDTFHIFEFMWDGPSSRVYFYFDGEETTRLSSFANTPNDEELRITVQCLTGSAAAITADIDWLRCWQIGRA